MVLHKIIFIACLTQCIALPAREEINVPEIKVSSPGEINSLNRQDLNANSEIKLDTDVEATIKEVEDLIKRDPNLPRLTRGEILDIIDNITKMDKDKLNNSNHRDQKAVMLVMPYSSDGGDLQTLYTKPPITRIVGDISKPTDNKSTKIARKPEIYYANKAQSTEKTIKPITDYPIYTTTSRNRITRKTTTTAKPKTTTEGNQTPITYETTVKHYRRRKPTIVTQKPDAIQPTFKPIREVTFKPIQVQKPTFKPLKIEEVTFKPIITQDKQKTVTFKPLRRHTTKPPKIEKYPNHKYSDEDLFIVHSTSVFPTEAPKPKPNQGINIVNPPKFSPKPEIPYKTSLKVDKPIYKTRIPKPTTQSPILYDGVNLPADFQDVLKNLDILLKNDPKYSSQYDSLTPLPKKPLTQENVKDLLASIGAYQPSTTTTTTTSTTVPDIRNVANNLSPDMQNLLMTFGLLADPNKKPEKPSKHPVYIEPTSEVSADSYSSFKPLPHNSNTNKEEGMDEFLASFGLGASKNGQQRSQKAIAVTNKHAVKPNRNLDAVPDDLKSVLKDISLNDKQNVSHKKVEKQHVFNPAESQFATTDEITRLNKLLDMIKQLEKLNGTNISDEDLKNIDLDSLKNLVGSFNVPLDEHNDFNPVDFDTSIVKNEVKRQQSSTTAAPLSASVSVSVSTEAKNPSLAALEDSFGGASDTARDVVSTTTTEAPKKTGFYYLVDWNTFLDIDNQKGKRVNLRFQPTIGDPKRFFNIAVP